MRKIRKSVKDMDRHKVGYLNKYSTQTPEHHETSVTVYKIKKPTANRIIIKLEIK